MVGVIGHQLGTEMLGVHMLLQRFTDTAVDPGTRQHRHELTARGQQQVDQARGGRA